jgi:hypothetical protein
MPGPLRPPPAVGAAYDPLISQLPQIPPNGDFADAKVAT